MALSLKADGLTASNQINATWFNDFFNLLTGLMNDQPVTFNYRPGSGTTPALTLKSDGRPLIKGFKSDNTTQAFVIDQNGNLTAAGSLTVNNGVTITGNGSLTGTWTAGSYTATATNAALELGNKTAVNTPLVDFNSSGFSNDFDARIIASGGVNGSAGQGSLSIQATGGVNFTGGITANAQVGITRSLGGSSKSFIQMAASDGKAYQWVGNPDGTLSLYNLTDAVTIAIFGPTSSVLKIGGKQVLFANSGLSGKFDAATTAPASPADGDLWLDLSQVIG